MDVELLNLNPEGWIPGVSNERNWGMLYGLDVCGERSLAIAGDTHGYLHFVDPRTSARLSQQLVHKKGNKVCDLGSLQVWSSTCRSDPTR